MSLSRRNPRRDTSERAIVQALRGGGFHVEFLSGDGLPDLLVSKAGYMALIEVKTGNKPLRDSQKAWHEAWRGPTPLVLRTVSDAIEVIVKWPNIDGGKA